MGIQTVGISHKNKSNQKESIDMYYRRYKRSTLGKVRKGVNILSNLCIYSGVTFLIIMGFEFLFCKAQNIRIVLVSIAMSLIFALCSVILDGIVKCIDEAIARQRRRKRIIWQMYQLETEISRMNTDINIG